MSERLEIAGRVWEVGPPMKSGCRPLLPLTGDPEGGVLRSVASSPDSGFLAALPDGVTSARLRTEAMARLLLVEHGLCAVYGYEGSGEWGRVHVVTAPKQKAVLRQLASVVTPGHWVCATNLEQAAGWRFGARIYELRKMGYPIERRPCEHAHHRTQMFQYRLPGRDL